MGDRYTLSAGMQISLMSVTHFQFGATAQKSRFIRFSGAGLISLRYVISIKYCVTLGRAPQNNSSLCSSSRIKAFFQCRQSVCFIKFQLVQQQLYTKHLRLMRFQDAKRLRNFLFNSLSISQLKELLFKNQALTFKVLLLCLT